MGEKCCLRCGERVRPAFLRWDAILHSIFFLLLSKELSNLCLIVFFCKPQWGSAFLSCSMLVFIARIRSLTTTQAQYSRRLVYGDTNEYL